MGNKACCEVRQKDYEPTYGKDGEKIDELDLNSYPNKGTYFFIR